MRLVFLVGQPALSGGNYVVLQHAAFAKERGHEVVVATMRPSSERDPRWHPALQEVPVRQVDHLSDTQFDVAIATWWRTVPELHRLRARQYLYFVQSIESRFYDDSLADLRALVDETYRLGLNGITEAAWIREHLRLHCGADYALVRNGIRKDLYCAGGASLAARDRTKLRVLVEGPFARIKNTARAARIAREIPGIDRWLLTTDDVSWFPGFSRVYSSLPIDRVPPVYRSCDVMLKLSLVEGMFGPPLEMFHCGGTAVVYDVTGHEEYIRDGHNALVVPMHDEAGARDALRRLRDDRATLERLKRGAAETAAGWPDWSESSASFLDAVGRLLESAPYARDELAAKSRQLAARFPRELRSTFPIAPQAAGRQENGWARLRGRLRPYRRLLQYVWDGYR